MIMYYERNEYDTVLRLKFTSISYKQIEDLQKRIVWDWTQVSKIARLERIHTPHIRARARALYSMYTGSESKIHTRTDKRALFLFKNRLMNAR